VKEARAIKPGEQLGYPVAGSPPIGANTGTAAAIAEEKKNAPLIARAGGIANVESPFKGGGEGTVETPNGPRVIPFSAATRAAIQPPLGGAPSPGMQNKPSTPVLNQVQPAMPEKPTAPPAQDAQPPATF